ncbi:MAG TPA: hypothetical protein P5548_02740 [Candidatus Moranbacteria bacterium]|nr:hypothetical protein [Candidatus Moranbacteria bacterium]HRZ33785.1 hypothetical protein [Candidatus Moranbacteria bacterium]
MKKERSENETVVQVGQGKCGKYLIIPSGQEACKKYQAEHPQDQICEGCMGKKAK